MSSEFVLVGPAHADRSSISKYSRLLLLLSAATPGTKRHSFHFIPSSISSEGTNISFEYFVKALVVRHAQQSLFPGRGAERGRLVVSRRDAHRIYSRLQSLGTRCRLRKRPS